MRLPSDRPVARAPDSGNGNGSGSAAGVAAGRAAGLMVGRRGLIMGVANDRSIAWGIAKACHAAGAELAFTYQGETFGQRVKPLVESIGAKVVAHATQLGDSPQLEKLVGPVKTLLDAYAEGKLSAVYLCYTRFVNTMKQEPVVQQLLPLTAESLETDAAGHAWDYLYEPDAPTVINELLVRYTEALVYQAVAENMASEQSARMVAMKAATDNAGTLIGELKLVYNKTRQAAITKELSEIVSGAAAISG